MANNLLFPINCSVVSAFHQTDDRYVLSKLNVQRDIASCLIVRYLSR